MAELNHAQRWVVAAQGVLLRHHALRLDVVGGALRPSASGKLAKLLHDEFGILSAEDAREVIDRLTRVDVPREQLALERVRALGVTAGAFGAYLLELEEAWRIMLAVARELQGALTSWAQLGAEFLAAYEALAGRSVELRRMERCVASLVRDVDSPWVTLPWTTPLGPASEVPTLDPQVLTVDAAGPGGFTTIGAALKVANTGDRLRILAGVYRERIWIETPVEIEGVGEVRVENEVGCCLMVKASSAVVRNIQFRSGTDPSGEAMHAVIVHRDFLKLIDCDVTAARIGVVLRDADAFVALQDTRVHDCASAGILCTEGLLLMSGGGVRQSGLANVQVEGQTVSRLERVTLSGAGQAGLAVQKGAEVDVLDAVITGNAFGVDATVAGRANLIGCRLEGNPGGGTRAFGQNSGLHLEGCTLADNGAVNVGADHGATVQAQDSELRGSACAGWADHGAHIRFERCRVRLGEEGLVREMNGGKVELVDSKSDVQPRA